MADEEIQLAKKATNGGQSSSQANYDWDGSGLLPCVATLEIPVPAFTVMNLLQLERGTIVETQWVAGAEIPVKVNKAVIAWSEFELLGDRLAARLTELI